MSSDRRFVILRHDHPFLHWDFLLETDGALRTWRLPAPPAGGTMDAEELADHRLAYLDYEGPVSGGRGTVMRHDRGVARVLSATGDRIEAELAGAVVAGTLVLERRAGAAWTAAFRAR